MLLYHHPLNHEYEIAEYSYIMYVTAYDLITENFVELVKDLFKNKMYCVSSKLKVGFDLTMECFQELQ